MNDCSENHKDQFHTRGLTSNKVHKTRELIKLPSDRSNAAV